MDLHRNHRGGVTGLPDYTTSMERYLYCRNGGVPYSEPVPVDVLYQEEQDGLTVIPELEPQLIKHLLFRWMVGMDEEGNAVKHTGCLLR